MHPGIYHRRVESPAAEDGPEIAVPEREVDGIDIDKEAVGFESRYLGIEV
jgi:hypothetical protein